MATVFPKNKDVVAWTSPDLTQHKPVFIPPPPSRLYLAATALPGRGGVVPFQHRHTLSRPFASGVPFSASAGATALPGLTIRLRFPGRSAGVSPAVACACSPVRLAPTAPMGLNSFLFGIVYYKHVAPTELAAPAQPLFCRANGLYCCCFAQPWTAFVPHAALRCPHQERSRSLATSSGSPWPSVVLTGSEETGERIAGE